MQSEQSGKSGGMVSEREVGGGNIKRQLARTEFRL